MASKIGQYGILIDGRDFLEGTYAGDMRFVRGPFKNLLAGIEARDTYENAVRWAVLTIADSTSGKALLDAIGKTKKLVAIKPYTAEEAKAGGRCNATSTALDDVKAGKKGEWIHPGFDDPKTPRDDRFEPILGYNGLLRFLVDVREPLVGEGTGSDVVIRHSPDLWRSGGGCVGGPGSAGATNLRVLFHELIHAYRQARGNFFSFPTGGARRAYDNAEEFFAVVLTNIYISDETNTKGANKTLRADHWGFLPLAPGLSTTAGFLAASGGKHLIDQLKREEPDLCAEFKKVKAVFNPLS